MSATNPVLEYDCARVTVTEGRTSLEVGLKTARGTTVWIPVTATLSKSKKDGEMYANLSVGGQQVRFIPEVAEAIANTSRARVDTEVSAV